MFQMIFKVFKNGQNRFGRSDKSVFGRFGRFMNILCKSLILKGLKADKKTDTTAKNISKNGRQNPLRGFGLSVNVGLRFLGLLTLIFSCLILASWFALWLIVFMFIFSGLILQSLGVIQ